MSMLLVGVTVAIGFGQQRLVGLLRRSARYINRIAGVILVTAGAYIVWFWSTSLTSGATALGENSAFRFVEDLSQRAFRLIGDHALVWGIGLATVIVAALLTVWLRNDDDAGSGEDRELAGATHGGN